MSTQRTSGAPVPRQFRPGPPALACLLLAVASPRTAAQDRSDGATAAIRQVAKEHCLRCHGSRKPKGDLDLESILPGGGGPAVPDRAAVWERVLRKLDAGQMPPPGKRRPQPEALQPMRAGLAGILDAAAAAAPRPGRTDTFRRLTRTEYRNAIRDLFGLDLDTATLLPADESGHGFDNVTVGDLSPALLSRYLTAAQTISRLVVGTRRETPDGHTFRVRPDITQERHVPGLPLGTRGGLLIRHHFPRSGTYEVQVRLARDRNEHVEGLRGSHTLQILLDRAQVAEFTVAKPKQPVANHFDDSRLHARVRVTAGSHDLGVTFVQNGSSLLETERQPLNVHFNVHRHPRLAPAVYQVSLTGPFEPEPTEPGAAASPLRRRLFGGYEPGSGPPDDGDERTAREILSRLARRAYRRPVADRDLAGPVELFRTARATGFDAGIEAALAAILVSPRFLFRIERDPAGLAPGTAYRIDDFELASRLSFFLWSSIPDETLLDAAATGELRRGEGLEGQVRRMLRDPRALALATNFAGQWLQLRNLAARTPDARLFPDFDHNLREAMRRETELLFAEVVREDRSVLDLLRADHTWLNERLARHYGIPHVLGSRFRRVELAPDSRRGGLLRHAGILTVTSYATRTSPVIRGKWILDNLLGTPPPPPPEKVPALDRDGVDESLTGRERLARHREDPGCARCHKLIDPVGFALENFDAVGQWRDLEAGRPVDASGGLPDGSRFSGVDGLEAALLARPQPFVATLVRKLLTFGLGRGVDHHDEPAVRRIVRDAAGQGNRFSAIVLGVVRSTPFQMRTSK